MILGGIHQKVNTMPSWTETQSKVSPGKINFSPTFNFLSPFIAFAMTAHRTVLST
jgi:hypothetical protein